MGLDTGSVVDPIKCVRPAAKAATFNGGVVDARGYRKVLFFQDVDAITGTSPTLDGKIQEATALGTDTVLQTGLGATDAWIPLRNNTNDNIELALSWTTVGAVTIYQVQLKLRQEGTLSAGDYVYLTIEGDSGGDPDGTPVATSELLDATTISTDTDGAYYTFTFKVPADLGATTDYHVVLKGNYTLSAVNQVQLGVETVASGGNLEILDASWADQGTSTVDAQGFSLSFADVSGATFTQVTDALGEAETPQEIEVDTGVNGPWLRYVGTLGGTTPSFTMAVTAIGGEKKVLV